MMSKLRGPVQLEKKKKEFPCIENAEDWERRQQILYMEERASTI